MSTAAEDDTLAPLAGSAVAWRGFDAAWYRVAADLGRAREAALLRHYLDQGRHAGLGPNMFFDEAWYRARHPDVTDAIAAGDYPSGYLHYCAVGHATHAPHWLYDDALYAANAPELTDEVLVENSCANRYDHYLKSGARERRRAHRLFAPATYAAAAGLADTSQVSPFAHYLERLWATRSDARTSPEFDPVSYLTGSSTARADIAAGKALGALHHALLTADALAGSPGRAAPLIGRRDLNVETVLVCPAFDDHPPGVLLIGWHLAPPETVVSVQLIADLLVIELDPARFLVTARPDVLAHHPDSGRDDPDCGFIAFAEGAIAAGTTVMMQLTYADNTTVRHTLPAPVLHGFPTIRALLDLFDLSYDRLARALDDIIGPAVSRLGAAVTRQLLGRDVIRFGDEPADPVLTLIVPLHGRIDFMEVQLALLSRGTQARAYDIIYVLDDPPRRREAELLAASCLARFGISFRMVMLWRNAGYAPANNAGLAIARGRHVALVNSDVFPIAADDFDRLTARLTADPALGAVGPVLLFEDGSVQHQGMEFKRLAQFGGLNFPLHPRKGLLPPADAELHPARAITGACMVLPTDLLRGLGGLDERFLIGDFEDADLCLKLAAAGRVVAVDHGVRMYHLERQSQAGAAQRWRMNLTLVNAWLHERRWGSTLATAAP